MKLRRGALIMEFCWLNLRQAMMSKFEFSPFGSVAEHSLGKGEVAGPIPAMGTIF